MIRIDALLSTFQCSNLKNPWKGINGRESLGFEVKDFPPVCAHSFFGDIHLWPFFTVNTFSLAINSFLWPLGPIKPFFCTLLSGSRRDRKCISRIVECGAGTAAPRGRQCK